MTWAFPDETSAYAEDVLGYLNRAATIVPRIWPFEVVNSLLVGERRRRITKELTAEFLQRLTGLAISVDNTAPDMERLVLIGRQYGTSGYDAAYLELASRQGVPLATLDDGLQRAAQRMGVELFDPR